IARVVADRLEGARYQQLDPVGAELDLAADCLADFLRAIGDQAIGDYRLLRRGEVDVTAAASDGDVMPRTRDARPAEYARLDHLAKVLVCIVNVDVAHHTNRRPSRLQLGLHSRKPHERLVRRGTLQVSILV